MAIRTIVLILLCYTCNAQDTIAIAGDSHCNGGFGVGDSNWATRTAVSIISRNPGSVAFKYCTGGETVKTNMPRWYPGSVAGKSVDDMLEDNCNILFFLQSGNATAFGIPQDTIKWCYLYLADTLTALGKRWAFSDIGPRQNTWFGGMDFDKYNAQRDSLNTWLYQTFPGHIFSLDTLLDRITNKPKAALLLGDSLHYGAVGHRYMWQATIAGPPFIDTVLHYDQIRGVNLRFTSTGATFDGVDAKYMQVYGSNDGVTFTLIDYREYTTGKTISAGGYAWLKLVIYNNTKRITITKRL
jgi:hypothetical protein